jgi:hypothetical protein
VAGAALEFGDVAGNPLADRLGCSLPVDPPCGHQTP